MRQREHNTIADVSAVFLTISPLRSLTGADVASPTSIRFFLDTQLEAYKMRYNVIVGHGGAECENT